MSALAWEPAAAPAPLLDRPRRPHLVVVPDDARRRPSGPLRITRRGRLTLFLATCAVLAAAVVALLWPASAAPAGRTVTVGAGQTLSEVAATQLPQLTVDEGIVAIQVANRLTGAQVHAGQQLVIPAP